jgi:hypothetical protein
MGLLLFVVAQFALYGLLWYGFRTFWPISTDADAMAYLGGGLHAFLIVAVALVAPRTYFYFRGHGWTADVREWASRVHGQVRTDWPAGPRGWDIDLLRVQCYRNHASGTLCLCLALLGVHVFLGLLIDADEAAAFVAAQQALRDEHLERLPPEIRQSVRAMMKDVPLDATLEISAVPFRPVSKGDDDDDGKVH